METPNNQNLQDSNPKAWSLILNRLEKMDKAMVQNSSKNGQPEWLAERAVAIMLKYTPRHLKNLRDKGILKYSKREGSRRIFYKYSDIAKFLEGNLH
jgi:hypothetical protein